MTRKVLFALSLYGVLLIAACGGGSGGGPSQVTATISSVSIACSPNSITAAQTSQCSATVTGTGNYSSAVAWSATGGNVSSSGVFTPSGMGTATVKATSAQDSTKSGSADVVVSTAAPSSITVMCNPDYIATDNVSHCSFAIAPAGVYSGAITWSATGGAITSGGVFTPSGPGTAAITATVAQYPSVTGTKQITVVNAVPWITSLTPASVPAGSAAQSITIIGSGFLAASTATFNGASRQVTYINPSQITIALTAADLQTVGSYPVALTNPAPGGGPSNTVSFTVRSATPAMASGIWTWMIGSDTGGQSGGYGTLGNPATGNHPGGRYSGATWTDNSGNFWLFGGVGYDASGTRGVLNDLWKYDPAQNQWAWMAGSNTVNQPGVYGTLGLSASGSVPGNRVGAANWSDSSGNLWLFGGEGLDAGGSTLYFNDLWMYSPANNQWTWMGGNNTPNQPGVYGTQGTPADGNVPGVRAGGANWVDSHGNFWLFGGGGFVANGSMPYLNDLWKYSPIDKQWTWMGGSNTGDQPGVYGTLGTPDAANQPGGRFSPVSWVDSGGNFWLFGGDGYVPGNSSDSILNDLWKYSPVDKQWTWMGGSNTVEQPGTYGTLGVPDADSHPGANIEGSTWTDSSGNFWLFGGMGYEATQNDVGLLSDLWKYNPATKQWAWMGGGGSADGQPGVYGTMGTPSAGNQPGSRFNGMTWADGSGNLWLFGGLSASAEFMNDLWRYQPTTPAASPITSVTAACTPASVTTAQTSQCVATVNGTGTYSHSVAWSATRGAITSAGVFTPSTGGTATITAVSTQDPSRSARTTVSSTFAVPTITSLAPSTLAAGSPQQMVTVNGTNFGFYTYATINGSSRYTEYVNPTQLRMQFYAGDLTTAGSYSIVVNNPTPGGGDSNAVTFVVTSKP